MSCYYCARKEGHAEACPEVTNSEKDKMDFKRGYQEQDWKRPIHEMYWKNFPKAYMLGYHKAERFEQSALEAAGNAYDFSNGEY